MVARLFMKAMEDWLSPQKINEKTKMQDNMWNI